jgi:hypothetical protein
MQKKYKVGDRVNLCEKAQITIFNYEEYVAENVFIVVENEGNDWYKVIPEEDFSKENIDKFLGAVYCNYMNTIEETEDNKWLLLDLSKNLDTLNGILLVTITAFKEFYKNSCYTSIAIKTKDGLFTTTENYPTFEIIYCTDSYYLQNTEKDICIKLNNILYYQINISYKEIYNLIIKDEFNNITVSFLAT